VSCTCWGMVDLRFEVGHFQFIFSHYSVPIIAVIAAM